MLGTGEGGCGRALVHGWVWEHNTRGVIAGPLACPEHCPRGPPIVLVRNREGGGHRPRVECLLPLTVLALALA